MDQNSAIVAPFATIATSAVSALLSGTQSRMKEQSRFGIGEAKIAF